jgi:citrate lyase beta subunit
VEVTGLAANRLNICGKSAFMRTSLSDKKLAKALSKIRDAQDEYARLYPGDSAARQAVHTVYGGANLFTADTARKLGDVALRMLEANAPDPTTFAEAIGVGPALATRVYERVVGKLRAEPVEDFRIDFEDGYGNRPDDEEDGHAYQAAAEVAKGIAAHSLPPFIGIRIKPLTGELAARSLRTLDIFLTTLVADAHTLPSGFVITLPKITSKAQVTTLVSVLEALEERLGLDPGALKIEFMVETTQCILDDNGRAMLPRLRDAAGDRLTGAHFGTYDYTAGYDITAAHQRMRHPACDFAKHMMKVTFAGTGVALSDGATNIMPVGPHRGKELTDAQKKDNQKVIHGAWRLGADDIRHSLINGYYQGWDLHPGQLPVRYGTVYGFFLDGQAAASERLKNFIDKAAQATLVGDVFDDAATGQGLLNYFLRGIACGAIKEDEAQATGLTLDEIRTRSFVKILAGRRAG